MPDSLSGSAEDARREPQEPTELQLETATEDPPASDAAPTLDESQAATLLRMLRVAYPHPSFPDAPYERTAKSVEGADADGVLAAGLAGLDEAAGGDFRSLSDEEATAALERIADSAFFKLVHSTTVVALYDDHEVWDLLGYEGSSFEKGGYLHRGFDDLDWLPRPRIEEYDGDEPRIEIATADNAGGVR